MFLRLDRTILKMYSFSLQKMINYYLGDYVKVITIKQPWASLIAEGYKEFEFRTWKTKYRGEILIHAGKGIDKEAMMRFKHLNLDYPIGKIIARAKITDCVYVDNDFIDKMYNKDPLVYRGIKYNDNWNGYGFKIEDVVKINPIDVNGKLSLWDYDYKEN